MPKYINKPTTPNPPRTLSDADFKAKLDALMGRISVGNPMQSDVKELFFLHNDRFLPRETGTSCGGCRARVYNRMKKHWESLNQTPQQ